MRGDSCDLNSIVPSAHILLYYMVMSTLGQDRGKVAMYTALAISADGGATFVKPELHLVDLGDGGKNNIIWPLEPKTSGKAGDHQTGTVFFDTKPGVPKTEMYKMLALWNAGGKSALATYAFSSSDGINWKVIGDPTTPLYVGSDTQQVCFYDEGLGKYVACEFTSNLPLFVTRRTSRGAARVSRPAELAIAAKEAQEHQRRIDMCGRPGSLRPSDPLRAEGWALPVRHIGVLRGLQLLMRRDRTADVHGRRVRLHI